jgi:hypothetical protein
MSGTLPDDLLAVQAAVSVSLAHLPEAEVAVLFGAGSPKGPYQRVEACLVGFGRPDLRVSRYRAGIPHGHDAPLPPSLAVLAFWCRQDTPVAPIALDPGASPEELCDQGACLVQDPRRVVVVAAGDLSAGLDERSPRFRIPGAEEWNEAAVTAVATADPDLLARLGPVDARRVVALGWAPMLAAVSSSREAGLTLQLRHYSAPRGVGYLVAHGST